MEAAVYHVGWTYPIDPFNVIAPEDILARQEFYDVLATPTFRMDGLGMGDASTLDWRYGQHKEWGAPATLELQGTFDAAARTLSLRVRASTDAEPPAGALKLFVALTESDIYFPMNGVDWHHDLLFDLLPDGAGTAVDLSGAPPRTAEVELTAVLPEPEGPFSFDPEHCRVVAWLQIEDAESADDRFVLQAAGRDVGDFGATAAPPPPPAGLRLAAHPNPFNPETRIAFVMPAAGWARLSLHDTRGRRVALLLDGDLPAGPRSLGWDAGELPGGVYLLRLRADGRRASAKLVLLR